MLGAAVWQPSMPKDTSTHRRIHGAGFGAMHYRQELSLRCRRENHEAVVWRGSTKVSLGSSSKFGEGPLPLLLKDRTGRI